MTLPISDDILAVENKNEITLSVICFAFNHEKYIVQAIESFLSQKTNFKLEIIVHDDASIDKTADIVYEYEEKFPELFTCIFQKENQYLKCPTAMIGLTFNKARGKYIALCEGDDFWTDPLKLQQQVDFLEANPTYSMSFHPSMKLYLETNITFEKPLLGPSKIQSTYNLDDLLRESNFIPTSSVVFRAWDGPNHLPVWFDQAKIGDFPLFLLIAKKGYIGFINKAMSAYRIHPGGVWTSAKSFEKAKIILDIYRLFRSEINLKQRKSFSIGISNYYRHVANEGFKNGLKLKPFFDFMMAIYYSIPFNFFNLVSKIIKIILRILKKTVQQNEK